MWTQVTCQPGRERLCPGLTAGGQTRDALLTRVPPAALPAALLHPSPGGRGPHRSHIPAPRPLRGPCPPQAPVSCEPVLLGLRGQLPSAAAASVTSQGPVMAFPFSTQPAATPKPPSHRGASPPRYPLARVPRLLDARSSARVRFFDKRTQSCPSGCLLTVTSSGHSHPDGRAAVTLRGAGGARPLCVGAAGSPRLLETASPRTGGRPTTSGPFSRRHGV